MAKKKPLEPLFTIDDGSGWALDLDKALIDGGLCVFTYCTTSGELTGVVLTIDQFAAVRDAMTKILNDHGRA